MYIYTHVYVYLLYNMYVIVYVHIVHACLQISFIHFIVRYLRISRSTQKNCRFHECSCLQVVDGCSLLWEDSVGTSAVRNGKPFSLPEMDRSFGFVNGSAI